MSHTKKTTLFFLGFAAALIAVWQIRQHRKKIDGLDDWQKIINKRHGPEKTKKITSRIRQEFARLLSENPMPINKQLRWHLKENILPGLALYRALLQEHEGNQKAALAELEKIFRISALAKSQRLLAPLKVLPAPFRVFKLGFSLMMKLFPAEGWDIEFSENNENQVTFNITRCFYLNTLTAYGAPELTASFCKNDDVMAECFPAEINFVREHTLGRGDTLCDFQYCRIEKA